MALQLKITYKNQDCQSNIFFRGIFKTCNIFFFFIKIYIILTIDIGLHKLMFKILLILFILCVNLYSSFNMKWEVMFNSLL